MIRYLTLAEYFLLAEAVTGIEVSALIAVARIELADSALHAPSAEFAGREFYPDIHDKAAVLVPGSYATSPGRDKRAAWLSLAMFIELNAGIWQPDPPDVDEAEAMMLAVAAGEATSAGSPIG